MSGGLAYLLLGVAAAAGYFAVPGMKGNGLVFNLIGLSAAAAIVVGTLRNRPKRRLPWLLFAAAQVCFVTGDLIYYTFDAVFPSVGDVFYLAVYPLLVAGLLMLIRDRAPWKDRASLLDASIITVGLALAVVVLLGARVGLGVLARRRRTRFADQLAETLQILAGSLRAGHGLAHSIESVAREAESPSAEEFRRLTIETRLGRDFVESLEALATRMGSEDFQWVAQASRSSGTWAATWPGSWTPSPAPSASGSSSLSSACWPVRPGG